MSITDNFIYNGLYKIVWICCWREGKKLAADSCNFKSQPNLTLCHSSEGTVIILLLFKSIFLIFKTAVKGQQHFTFVMQLATDEPDIRFGRHDFVYSLDSVCTVEDRLEK